MTRILHLSDLHFGRVHPKRAEALLEAAAGLGAQVSVVSGDLTQRARPHQFSQAMDFVRALPGPHFVVPGNHDIPLDRPLGRLFAPWAPYTRHVGAHRAPCLDLPGLRLVGINTATPWHRERGHLGQTALEQACTRLMGAPKGAIKAVVLHHPLIHPPHTRKPAMRDGALLAAALVAAGADIILSGHLHTWGAQADVLCSDTWRAIAVSSGTSLSTRLRGEGNDFTTIDADPQGRRIAITRWATSAQNAQFLPQPTLHFARTRRGWALEKGGTGGVQAVVLAQKNIEEMRAMP